MEGLSRLMPRLRVSRLAGAVLIGLAVFAGYLFAGWVSGPRDTTQLARICAQVDYVNSLQDELPTQQAATEEIRNEFAMLVEQCRLALGDRGEESD
jgi:hypothetical protein